MYPTSYGLKIGYYLKRNGRTDVVVVIIVVVAVVVVVVVAVLAVVVIISRYTRAKDEMIVNFSFFGAI